MYSVDTTDAQIIKSYVQGPDVVVKTFQGKMISQWALKTKVAAFLLAFALYVYILLFVKTMYLKSQRLDRIANMAMETEKMMRHVREIDRNFVVKMEYLDDTEIAGSY